MKNSRVLILILLSVFFLIGDRFVYGEVLANVNWYVYNGRFMIDVRSPQSIKYVTFALEDPLRLVLDVYNATFPRTEIFNIGITPIKVLRLSPRDENSFRLVLECEKVPQYNITLSKDEKTLTGEFFLEKSDTFNLIKKILYGGDRVSIYNTGSSLFKSNLDTNPPKLILEFSSTSFSGEIKKLDNSKVIDRIIAYNYEDIYKNINTVVVVALKSLKEPLILEDKESRIVSIDFGGPKISPVTQTSKKVEPQKQEIQKSPVEQGKRISISFKDADIKDILQALSIKAGVNILVDDGINKRLTLRLENVTAREGLEMITKASGLAYEKWDNGYIVATPERLGVILDSGLKRAEALTSRQVVSTVEIKGDITQVQNAIKAVYPEVITSISGKYLVIKGEESKLNEIKGLISTIDKQPEVRAEVKKEVVEVEKITGDLEKIAQSLKAIYPELTIVSANQYLIIKGEETKVKEAIGVGKKLEVEPVVAPKEVKEEKVREIVKLKELDSQSMKEILGGITDIQIGVVKQTNTLILQGDKSKVEDIKKLISELDVESKGGVSKEVVSTVEIKGDITQVQNAIKAVYPEVITSISGKYLVIKGEESKLNEIKGLISTIDKQPTEQMVAKSSEKTERVFLTYVSGKDFIDSIKGLFPDGTFEFEPPTNSIIIKGTDDIISRVKEFIKAVDVPTPQYMLEAKLVEVNRDGALLLGIDSSLTGNVNVGLSSSPFSLESLTSLVSSTVQLNAILNMAQSKGLAKVIAAPKIATSDGKEANIFIGDSIYYNIPRPDGGFDLRQVNAGITLNVTPKMERDKSIDVKLTPEVSSITGWTGSGATIAPNIGTRRASTEVKVKDGDTIVIGGLMRSSDTETLKKVPLLSNIPILGQLFQSRDNKQEERELIIMLTVNVVKEEGK